MNKIFYKPNSKNTGHACSFQLSLDQECVFLNFVKQKGYNSSSGRSTFHKSEEKDFNKMTTLKISLLEIAKIILSIRNNKEAKLFHSFDGKEQSFTMKEYISKKNGERGHSLAANNGQASFLMGLTEAEGEELAIFLEWACGKIYDKNLKVFLSNRK